MWYGTQGERAGIGERQPIPEGAQEANRRVKFPVLFRPARHRVRPGEVFVLDLVIGSEIPGLVGCGVRLRYDEERLELLDVRRGSMFGGMEVSSKERARGLCVVMKAPCAAVGCIATATFRAGPSPGQAHVRVKARGYRKSVLLSEALGRVEVIWGEAEINIEEWKKHLPVMALVPRGGEPAAVKDRDFLVDVAIRNVHNLSRAWFTVSFNQELLKYHDAAPGDFFDGHGGIGKLVEKPLWDGRSSFLAYRWVASPGGGPRGISGSGRLATLRFRAIASSWASKEKPAWPELGRTGMYLLAEETGLWDAQDPAERRSRMRFYREGILVRTQRYAGYRRKEGKLTEEHLQERDLDILQVMHEHGFLAWSQFCRWFPQKKRASGRASPAAYRRDQRLVKGGLIERFQPEETKSDQEEGSQNTELVVRIPPRIITSKGVEALDSRSRLAVEGLKPIRKIGDAYEHDRQLIDLRLDLRDRAWPHMWVPERVVRRLWQRENAMLKFAPDALLEEWGPRRLCIALELERDPKKHRKFRKMVVRYRNLIPMKEIDWILMLVPNDDAREWFLENALVSAQRQIRGDDKLKEEVGEYVPTDYFKVAIVEEFARRGQEATGMWRGTLDGKVRRAPLHMFTGPESWGGQELSYPLTYEAVLEKQRVFLTKEIAHYVDYVRWRGYGRDWSRLDKMLRRRRMIGVDQGTLAERVEGPKLHVVSRDFKLMMVRVLIKSGPHRGSRMWAHASHYLGDEEEGQLTLPRESG